MVLRVYQHDSWGLWGWSREGAWLTSRGHEHGPGGVKHRERPGLCPDPCLGETCLLGSGWMPTPDLWTGVPCRLERERGPSTETKKFQVRGFILCTRSEERDEKKYLQLYTPHFYDSKELWFYSQLQFTARLSKPLGRCTYKGPWLKRQSEIRRHLLIEKPKENSVSRREWPTDLSAAKRSLGRMEDFTEIKLLDTGPVYFFWKR